MINEDFDDEKGPEKDTDSLSAVIAKFTKIQEDLNELEEVYPDLHDDLDGIRASIKAHEDAIHRIGDQADELHHKGALSEDQAKVVASAIESTISSIQDLANEEGTKLLEKAQLDLMIQQLTQARLDLLKAVKPPEA